MAEEPLPDWLTEMRGQSFGDQPASQPEAEPSLPPSEPLPPSPSPDLFAESEPTPPFIEEPEPDRFSQLFADLEPLEPDSDMIGDLREQIVLQEDELDDVGRGVGFQLPSPIPGLTSAQCFVVAVLFFLDVALCGCMILFMTGRMGLPY
jgi:hypothetical protein